MWNRFAKVAAVNDRHRRMFRIKDVGCCSTNIVCMLSTGATNSKKKPWNLDKITPKLTNSNKKPSNLDKITPKSMNEKIYLVDQQWENVCNRLPLFLGFSLYTFGYSLIIIPFLGIVFSGFGLSCWLIEYCFRRM